MVPEYERAVTRLCDALALAGIDEATRIASLPDQVRGYEHLKLARAEVYRRELAERLAAIG
jgi:indolepyruvate ferredoxin oxidoreductase